MGITTLATDLRVGDRLLRARYEATILGISETGQGKQRRIVVQASQELRFRPNDPVVVYRDAAATFTTLPAPEGAID